MPKESEGSKGVGGRDRYREGVRNAEKKEAGERREKSSRKEAENGEAGGTVDVVGR